MSEPTDPVAADLVARRPRPTMRDVAAVAAVSLKTVSRVVNGETTVDPALAERVRHATSMLGYQPNLTARNLRRSGGRTLTIGLLLEDIANPYSSAVHRAVEDAAAARGIAVFAGSLDEDPERERALTRELVARRVDGLLVVPTGEDQSYLGPEQQAGLSVVFVDRRPALLKADAVVSDNVGGAHAAVRHLVGGGHRRIGVLADLSTIATARERVDGALAGLAEAGIEPDPALLVQNLRGVEHAYAATLELIDGPRPSALFATQNLLTIGAVRALRHRGLHHDVALVGFDDFLFADLLDPAVSVIAQDPGAIGATACELLFARMDGESVGAQQRTIPTSLVARGSGEIQPRIR